MGKTDEGKSIMAWHGKGTMYNLMYTCGNVCGGERRMYKRALFLQEWKGREGKVDDVVNSAMG